MSDTATRLETRPLHPAFGVEVLGVDLARDPLDEIYPALRDLFERHSAVLLRGQQDLPSDRHLELVRRFGPIEDRKADERADGEAFEIPKVSNRAGDGQVYGEHDLNTLNLKANQLWHTDSTFLPVPALANAIVARVVTSHGGETELASTRAAFRSLSQDRQERLRNSVLHHHYAHSRARISPELADWPMFNKWPAQRWRAVWPNPVTGEEAVYVASHAFAADGLARAAGQALVDELIETCTRPEFVYTHAWAPGDVLIFDERATLHRGRPWPYEQERTLEAICVSATEDDGLEAVRPPDLRS
jgi:alpha-ketoglutarate-dependent 2,4-dichlorophenoxyacetate dioxygenase